MVPGSQGSSASWAGSLLVSCRVFVDSASSYSLAAMLLHGPTQWRPCCVCLGSPAGTSSVHGLSLTSCTALPQQSCNTGPDSQAVMCYRECHGASPSSMRPAHLVLCCVTFGLVDWLFKGIAFKLYSCVQVTAQLVAMLKRLLCFWAEVF